MTMADSLHITSYNCRGLLKTLSKLYVRPDIIGLFDVYDLIFFQETWLAKQYLDNCNSLHPNYFSVNVAAVDYSSGLLKGRPHGGVSIFYHRRLSSSVKPLYFANSDWCVGIDLTVENTSFSLINVYLPYENRVNDDEYTEKLSILENITDSFTHSNYAFLGDWNANIKQCEGVRNHCFMIMYRIFVVEMNYFIVENCYPMIAILMSVKGVDPPVGLIT